MATGDERTWIRVECTSVHRVADFFRKCVDYMSVCNNDLAWIYEINPVIFDDILKILRF